MPYDLISLLIPLAKLNKQTEFNEDQLPWISTRHLCAVYLFDFSVKFFFFGYAICFYFTIQKEIEWNVLYLKFKSDAVLCEMRDLVFSPSLTSSFLLLLAVLNCEPKNFKCYSTV